ncbi:MAG: hypothetical protein C5B54_08805 [Acidobacteria bacterium]|nr:MAG: hypothetical protein C5B54_08805 [Acidobacteriota bacterium]
MNILQPDATEIAGAVTPREYNRVLGMPRDRVLEDDLLERAQSARRWFEENGNPFVAYERVELNEVTSATCLVGSRLHLTELRSVVLAQRLKSGEAHALIVMVVSAGPNVAEQVALHWKEGRPDEAFFLDRLAVAITEHLVFWASGNICRASERERETLLPHLAPGCGNWDINDQHKLMSLLTGGAATAGPVQLLSTGALHPQHSYLTAMGVTRHNFPNSPEYLCRSCDLKPCSFRRAPYRGDLIFSTETNTKVDL